MNLCDTPIITLSSPPINHQNQQLHKLRNEITSSYSYPPTTTPASIPSTTISNQLTTNHNNNIQNVERSSKEYHLCAMFSILYPFKSNFALGNNSQVDSNGSGSSSQSINIPFIPVLGDDQPVKSWSEIMDDEDEEMMNQMITDDSQSTCSDISSINDSSSVMFDMDDILHNNGESLHKKKTKNNANKKSQPNSPNSSSRKTKNYKKVFIGGVKFDDLDDQEDRQIRILKLLHLFQSLGKIESIDAHWEKGYCFITYLQNGVAQRVVNQMSDHSKRSKMIHTIKSSLLRDNLKANCAPLPSFYVRLPSNKSNSKRG